MGGVDTFSPNFRLTKPPPCAWGLGAWTWVLVHGNMHSARCAIARPSLSCFLRGLHGHAPFLHRSHVYCHSSHPCGS